MSKRVIFRRLACASKPCPEFGYWEFANQREYLDHAKRVREWRCLRHDHPEKVLSLENPRREWISEPAARSERFPDLPDLFFGSHGFLHGDGYYAYAKDFPAGTRIRVTAEVLLPNPTPTPEPKETRS